MSRAEEEEEEFIFHIKTIEATNNE